jgi:aquaporin Z
MRTTTFFKFVAGFFGPFILVLMGFGSAIVTGANGTPSIGLLEITFAFGLSVVAMVYAIGHILGWRVLLERG